MGLQASVWLTAEARRVSYGRLRIILAPRRQKRQVRIHFFLCGPFDFAQDMLCAFARDISAFRCGFAALGLCGECFFTGNPEWPFL